MTTTITEDDIAKVLRLVPAHSTVESLRATAELDHLTIGQILEALDLLKVRGEVHAEELFGR